MDRPEWYCSHLGNRHAGLSCVWIHRFRVTGDWDPDAQPIQVHGDAPSQPAYLQARSEPAQFILRECVGRRQYICKEIHLRCQPRISEVFAVSTGTLPLNDNAPRRFRQRTLVVMLTNDIRSRVPEWLSEWDFERNDTDPGETAVTSAKKVWWKCVKGHAYLSSPSCRIRGHGCVYCAGKEILLGFNDFASGYPELLEEWDYRKNRVDPSEITRFTHSRVWWIDAKGHEWMASVANRAAGNGCPYCAGRKVLGGFNDLAGCYPEIALEWDDEKNGNLRPAEVTSSSNRLVWWRCGAGHSWRASVAGRTGGNGCPYCGNRKVWSGFNDLLSCMPETAREWDVQKNGGLKPDEVTFRTGRLVWWKCGEGHSYRMSVYSRWKGKGCPYCGGTKVLSGFNDLRTVTPWIAEEWDDGRNGDLKPEDVFPYTNRKVWWKCENGHHWKSTVNSRQKGSGCPYCHGILPRTPHFIS